MDEKRYTYMDIIEELSGKGSVLGLTTMRNLLDELEHPEEALSIIHFAGTNGKGSTIAFVDSVLREAGYTVGRYISPTIVSYEERFQINGEMIQKDELEYYFRIIHSALDRIRKKEKEIPTIFEVETAISFLYFKEHHVEYVLLETGMGGRLDATNVVEHPLLTVLTSISYDHMQFLGNTLTDIAREKAGIIKENIPVILAPNEKEVQDVIRKIAVRKKAECRMLSEKQYSIIEEMITGSIFEYEGERYQIALLGEHQVSNAVTAISAIQELAVVDNTMHVTLQNIKDGLSRTQWPGRLEVVGRYPLFFLDGMHNPDGAKKLEIFLEKHFTNKKIIYIMGVLKDKDYEKMLSYIIPKAQAVFIFKPDNIRGLEAQVLYKAVEPYKVSSFLCNGVKDAVYKAREYAKEDDVIVACGSLSFMEELKQHLGK